MTKYLIIAAISLMSACAHPPVHEPVSVYKQNIVKDMQIPSDKSRIVFFLGKSAGMVNLGSRIPMNIFIDGKLIGNIGRYSDMVVTDLVPGKHTLSANGMPEYDPELGYIPKPITVNLIVGEQSFYRTTLRNTASMTYSVSLEKDDNGANDLSNHTVVTLYSETASKQASEPVKEQNTNNDTVITSSDIEVKMRKIKKMYEKGLITRSEYDLKRKTLLENY